MVGANAVRYRGTGRWSGLRRRGLLGVSWAVVFFGAGLSGGPAAAEDAPGQALVLSQRQVTARVSSLEPLRFAPVDGASGEANADEAIDRREVVRFGVAAEPMARAQLQLVDGSRLVASQLRFANDRVLVRGAWGPLDISLEWVEAIWLVSPREVTGIPVDREPAALRGADDALLLRDGTWLRGRVKYEDLHLRPQANPEVRWSQGSETYEVPLARVAALVPHPVLRRQPVDPGDEAAWVGLRDGSWLRLATSADLRFDEFPWLAAGERLRNVSPKDVVMFAPHAPSTELIIARAPARVRQLSAFGEPPPLKRWGPVSPPVMLDGRGYSNGLLTVATSRIVYAVEGPATLRGSLRGVDQRAVGATVVGRPSLQGSLQWAASGEAVKTLWQGRVAAGEQLGFAVEIPADGYLILASDGGAAGALLRPLWLDVRVGLQ